MIQTQSLEIFKQNHYIHSDIGFVSNNAYLSIIATNDCQMNCTYCINSETDHSLHLPIDKAISNIKKLVSKYKVKEAIILGGEPLLHPNIFTLIKKLRLESGLEIIRLTTNGIKIKNDFVFLEKLVDERYGIHGLNISFHNEDFMTFGEIHTLYRKVKEFNPNVKIRINTNIWKGNNDNVWYLRNFIQSLQKVHKCCDEIRISNIIPKDYFSVNPINHSANLVLSNEEYINLFEEFIDLYKYEYEFCIFENKETLGFVRYVLIPTPKPIIINWNIGSTVSDQICENDISTRKINTFKCLVSGDISLSWNKNNILSNFEVEV